MSFLKKIKEEIAADLTVISPMLQQGSAWTAWVDLSKNAALKSLVENVRLSAAPRYAPDQWAVLGSNGVIYANPRHLAPLAEWRFVLAHMLAHLGMRHPLKPDADPRRWLAYEMAANALVSELGVGQAPEGFRLPPEGIIEADEIYEMIHKNLDNFQGWRSPAGIMQVDIVSVEAETEAGIAASTIPNANSWAMMLTQGLLDNIGGSGKGAYPAWVTVGTSKARQALNWFSDNFPLLSALAAHFRVIEDKDLVDTFDISIAAVVPDRMEILVNPDVDLSLAELKFIMGHELMHVGLLHHKRKEDRDHFVWNLACDFVINAWLIEMGVGDMPPRGGLFNPAFVGMSANEIYDKLIKDPNYTRQLITFRGMGTGDILPPGANGNARRIGTANAGDYAETLMKQGIDAHIKGKRGLLPAGMLEMVTPSYQPPPPWKISLKKWFESQFEPQAPARSYARQSRRQQATPNIPRPRYALPQFPDGSGIFGVMLDTSGSMSNHLLSQCLGAIASLAELYNIKKVRLVFCDTTPHDEGFVPIKRLMEPMHIRGRGGTRLQPGIDLLEAVEDFPKDAPILVITDAECDELTLTRDHAFLIPEGKELPFDPVGPVFWLK